MPVCLAGFCLEDVLDGHAPEHEWARFYGRAIVGDGNDSWRGCRHFWTLWILVTEEDE
jgi:hypothetical protein